MIKFYNQELKEEFILLNAESYGKISKVLFKQTKKFEEKFEKDLYEFNIEEIKEFLIRKNYRRRNTLSNVIYTISKYIDFNIQKNNIKLNVIEINGPNETIEETLSQMKIVVLDNQELKKLLSKTVNYQDKFVINALFEGVEGEMLEEIIASRIEDFDEENKTLKLYSIDEEGERHYKREIKISDEFINIAKEANKETIFTSITGDKRREVFGDNIIKYSNNENRIKQKYWTIIQRISKVLKMNEYNMTLKDIMYSGMVSRIKDMGIKESQLKYFINHDPRGEEILKQYNKGQISSTLRAIKERY